MALGLSLTLFALVFLGAPLVLNHLGLEPLVRKVALGYLRFLSLGIIPLLLFSVVRSFLDALGLTRSPCISCFCSYLSMVSSISSSSYGIAGLPELGELEQVWELHWLTGPFSLFPSAVIRKHKKVKPYQIEKIQPLDKTALLDALN